MRHAHFVLAIVLGATYAEAAGTSVKGNVVPIEDVCLVTNCDLTGESCVSNSDCYVGETSPKSKVSLTGAGRLKASFKGVLDDAQAEASGEYILYIEVTGSGFSTSFLTIKTPIVAGAGKIDVDVNSLLGPTGSARGVQANLKSPPDVPGDCPGDNSIAGIMSRVGDNDCHTGDVVGQLAVVSGDTSSLKYNVAPIAHVCDGGFCQFYVPDSCSINADCSEGSASYKSKTSVKGDGTFKISLKDVVDSAGMEATGDYILRLETYLYPSGTNIHNIIKVPVVAGKGKATAELATRLGPAGSTVLFVGFLQTPPAIPGDCPGAGNTAADLAMRENDFDCNSGEIIGYAGITPGL